MSHDKERFVAKYGIPDLDKELEKDLPNLHMFTVGRDDLTRQHVLKALGHKDSDVVRNAVSSKLVKRSELESMLKDTTTHPDVKKTIDSRFKYEEMVKNQKGMYVKPYYPEDKE